MRYSYVAFPLVGVVIGVLLWLWFILCDAIDAGGAIRGLGIAMIPLLVTGGIHMDGFGDTVDAIASRAEPEKRRRIMKDPTIGVFASIGIASYLLIQFALGMELEPCWRSICCLCISPVISRCISGLVSTVFPGSSSSGILSTFRESAASRIVVASLSAMLAVLFVALGFLVTWGAVVAFAAVSLFLILFMRRMAMRRFGGMSGDLAGYLLQVLELAFLVIAYAVGRGWL